MIARRESTVFTHFALADGEEFRFRLDVGVPPGVYHVAGPLWLEDGVLVVRAPYTWDGNSCKIVVGPLVIGVSDGPVLPDGTPAGKWPSCGHDVIYEHWPHLIARCGVSGADLRAAADRWYRHEWLMQLARLPDDAERRRWRRLVTMCYYPAVRVLGAPLWWRRAVRA